jgi:TRAP-type C4-dicarboxylate transport system permease small subunit
MLDAFERGFERALRLLAYAGGLVLSGLVLLVVFEIGMRYFFGRPFRGGYEITELAMAVIVACGLPYTAIVRGHVSVDILSGVFDRPSFRWLNFLVHIAGAALLAVVAWQSYNYAVRSAEFGVVSNMMKIPKSPIQMGVSLSLALFSVALLLDAIRVFRPKSKSGQETT